MRAARSLPLLLMLLAGCSQKPDPDREIQELLPKDAQIVVRFSSIEDVDEWFGMMAMPVGPRSLAAFLPKPPQGVVYRRDLPLGFGASAPRDGVPSLAVAVPVTDPALFVKAVDGDPARALQRYAGIAQGSSYPEGGCRMWEDLPDRDLFVRADLARLGGMSNPLVASFLASASGVAGMISRFLPFGFDAGAAGRDAVSGLGRVFDEGERLDASFDIGADFRAEVTYVAKEGSSIAAGAARHAGLADLAAHAEDGWPVLVLAHVDPAWATGLAGIPGLPEGLEGLSGDWMIGGRIDAGGPRGVIVTRAADAKRAAAALADLLLAAPASQSGLVLAQETRDEAPFLCRIRVTADPARGANGPPESARAFLGPKGFVIEIAAKDDLLLLALGREAGAARLLDATKPPKGVADLLTRLGGDVRFLAAIDAGVAFGGLRAMMERIGDENAKEAMDRFPDFGSTSRAEIYGVTDGRTWRVGFRADRSFFEAEQAFLAGRRFR
jgi:hypothetical protein